MSNEITDIEKQIAELTAKKQAIMNSQRQAVIQQVRTLINQYSLEPSELGIRGKVKSNTDTSKAAPKYADPHNPHSTWAGGKGARPKWVKAHLANGGSLDDLLITRI
jgi:DNA-binding protein H-NS